MAAEMLQESNEFFILKILNICNYSLYLFLFYSICHRKKKILKLFSLFQHKEFTTRLTHAWIYEYWQWEVMHRFNIDYKYKDMKIITRLVSMPSEPLRFQFTERNKIK
ncbi:hypothetical protein Anas_04702 [Armadillidium nasatum]|uniref:Uncharacterized protein n=1 Tax=Armadillidium nasatum TaxID=96803 RepID=A0A5N5SRQ8_9CRUS|nr:hypothetical protein Anas_04702 [Armadillidium nasatum]